MDTKLKDAMCEIRGICKKNDIGGFFILASEDKAEFGYELEPSFSAAKWNENKDYIHFIIKEKEVGKEMAERMASGTINLFCSIQDLCAMGFSNMTQMINVLSKHISFDRGNSEIKPHYDN